MSDDDQTRVATVSVTNAADTDELQTLITLLENRFTVDVRMQDGEMRVLRDSHDSGDATDEDEIPSPDEHRDVDELLEGMVEAVRDLKEGRTTSDTEEVRRQIRELREAAEIEAEADAPADSVERTAEAMAADAPDPDADRDVEEEVDAAVDSFEKKLDKMDDAEEPDESETSEEPLEDETDESESEDSDCQYCGKPCDPRGRHRHEMYCDENPDNDSEESNEDGEDSAEKQRYRCGGCGDTFVSERGVKVHQGRSRDCTGTDVEPVEQTDTSSDAGSAADPTGDDTDTLDDTADEDDPELDPEVGAVPIDPDTVDEAVVDDDEDLMPDEEADSDGEDKHRVRREPSTVRDVVNGPAGQYLCLDCGFVSLKTYAARNHDFRTHDGYTRDDGEEYRQLERVPDDELAERWLVIYKNVGSTWTHPKLHEARKNGIVHVLKEAEYFLDVAEIREQLNEYLEITGEDANGQSWQITYGQLTDDPGYLDELVDEGHIEQDGKTYGVDAERAAELVEATA